MSTELLALCIMAGIALGSVAFVPLMLMITRTPKAGRPLKVSLTADVAAYQEAMRGAGS